MSMKMVCNRCNKVKEDGESFDRIRYICSEPELLNEEYDLCPECSKLFSIFLDGGEVEEDRYKDSKPSAVVIHKLANGHYAIENAPKGEETPKHSCVDCAYSYRYNSMLCCGGECGGDFVNADMICSSWESKEDDMKTAMDKEESDSCVRSHKVTSPTTGETVTIPDSEPWSSFEGRKKDKTERCFG